VRLPIAERMPALRAQAVRHVAASDGQ
jgi:hypothetical protein